MPHKVNNKYSLFSGQKIFWAKYGSERVRSKYLWTNHSRDKMRYYRLGETRIKRIIRHPVRVEGGIIEDAVACMQPAGGKRYSEIWVMYILNKSKIKIITAWRYPGRSPQRDPIPPDILQEIKNLIEFS